MLAAVFGCGGGDDAEEKNGADRGKTFEAAIREAQRVDLARFPVAKGKTLQQLAGALPAVKVGLASSVFTPGANRLAFGVIDQENAFVYGETAVYLARKPRSGPVLGPFAAPADPLVVSPAYRSKGAALATDDIAAIYEARVDLPKPGKWYALTVSRAEGKSFGAATEIEVERSSPIPSNGERPPAVETDTVRSAGGDIASIDTRVPPDDMHDTSFRDVLGKKPIALLFATPQLCQSRVCGPVVDIAAQLKEKYGDQMEFIHQEVYVDNKVDKGLRPPLRAFNLRTEPWLFTIDGQGRVAARLEGSFGREAFERSIKAGLAR